MEMWVCGWVCPPACPLPWTGMSGWGRKAWQKILREDDDDYDGAAIGIQRITMMMRLVMMFIWTGMWGWGHRARRQILWW